MDKARRSLALATTIALIAGLLTVGASSAGATGVTAVYDSIGASVPGNVASVGFEATSASELGDLVRLAPGPRVLSSVTVEMSSWGCETGGWNTNDCSTTSGATFSHPLTLNVYAVNDSGLVPVPGALLATNTSAFLIPFRPSANPTCTGGRWLDGANCFNGLATPVTFTFPGTTVLPNKVIWTIAYNTTNHGAAPIGPTACGSNCGYDSLNVGADSLSGTPTVGTDIDPNGIFWSTTFAGFYCDGGDGGVGILREDTDPGACGWSANRPMATIRTTEASLTASTVVVDEGNPNGWFFFDDNGTGSPLGTFVTGPAPTPLGSGSAHLATPAAADGQMLATPAYAGTPLANLTSMDYSSYQTGPVLAIALQFDVRYRLTDTSYGGRLVFEPYQNGAVTVDSGWQNWSGLNGWWWSSKTTSAGSNGLCPIASPCTWNEVLNNWPDAKIFGNTLFKAGSNWAGFSGNVDAFTIGVDDGAGNITETTYDFEHQLTLGPCAVSITGTSPTVYTLLADCITDHTILVPQHIGGTVFDGNDHSITGVDPVAGHFLGAVVQGEAGPDLITVENLTVTVSGLADACDGGVDRLRGILFDGVAGSITDNDVIGIRQGTTSGCQEGNGIEVRNEPFDNTGSDLAVSVTGNTVTAYQKTGIVANGSVAVTITGNTVTGDGPVNYIAQNGIQVGFGATAIVKNNTASGNDYTPKDFVACGLLIFEADGVKASSNNLFNNERNLCNFGKGGGHFNPAP